MQFKPSSALLALVLLVAVVSIGSIVLLVSASPPENVTQEATFVLTPQVQSSPPETATTSNVGSAASPQAHATQSAQLSGASSTAVLHANPTRTTSSTSKPTPTPGVTLTPTLVPSPTPIPHPTLTPTPTKQPSPTPTPTLPSHDPYGRPIAYIIASPSTVLNFSPGAVYCQKQSLASVIIENQTGQTVYLFSTADLFSDNSILTRGGGTGVTCTNALPGQYVVQVSPTDNPNSSVAALTVIVQ
jgi:hypothetical protein